MGYSPKFTVREPLTLHQRCSHQCASSTSTTELHKSAGREVRYTPVTSNGVRLPRIKLNVTSFESISRVMCRLNVD
jgi:hypothetical protein